MMYTDYITKQDLYKYDASYLTMAAERFKRIHQEYKKQVEEAVLCRHKN